MGRDQKSLWWNVNTVMIQSATWQVVVYFPSVQTSLITEDENISSWLRLKQTHSEYQGAGYSYGYFMPALLLKSCCDLYVRSIILHQQQIYYYYILYYIIKNKNVLCFNFRQMHCQNNSHESEGSPITEVLKLEMYRFIISESSRQQWLMSVWCVTSSAGTFMCYRGMTALQSVCKATEVLIVLLIE